jgi:hypothetical protein
MDCPPHERVSRFRQIARGADDGRAMRDKRTRSLNAQAGRDARDKHPLARKIDALENLLGGRFRSESLGHCAPPTQDFLWRATDLAPHLPR